MNHLLNFTDFDAVPMNRVIIHWTAGAGMPSALDKSHYHFLIDEKGGIHRGVHIARNSAKGVKDGYAAHTFGCNTGSIGISLCGMRGAVKKPFAAGPSPINFEQLKIACRITAECMAEYGILLSPKTVLTHAEVQNNLGIKQRGKWDIAVFPWAKNYDTPRECGDFIRELVKGYS
jgi:N-acetyl-anhydromuramyl-L-alanine amidase AmpD